MSTIALVLRIWLAAHPVARPLVAQAPVYLDLSGPSEPESEFPVVTAKGRL